MISGVNAGLICFTSLLCLELNVSAMQKPHVIASETSIHRFSYKEVIWKYAANLQENSHAKG